MFKAAQKLFSIRIPLLPALLALVTCAVFTCAATQAPTHHAAANQVVEPSLTQVVNDLRASINEWDDETGRYAWLTNPLRDRGVTTDEVLRFCDIFSPQEP